LTDRCVVILSPHFPPSTLAGVHRARHMAKHLPAHGWRPIVVRADERAYTETADPALADLVPERVEQVRVGAFPARLSRWLGVSDIGLRAYSQLASALSRTIASRRPAVVFITGSPFYPMLLSRMVKQRFGVPVVLDFQDPWVSAYGAAQPALSKAGLAHRLATVLEPAALRGAAFVTSVSDIQNSQMGARYPWLSPGRMTAIPIGGDPEDFEALRADNPASPQSGLEPDVINLSYVGTFLPRAEPLIRVLFRALRILRAQDPELASRIRCNFIGTTNQPNDYRGFRVLPIARDEGVGDLVRETPQRVPYLQALGVLANSQALLLIGSDEPHYTASKIYPALMSRRPFVSLFHRASSAHRILSAAGGGRALAFETPEELAALQAPVADAIRTLATQPQAFGTANPEAYAPYTAHAVAGQYAAVFDRLAGGG
jgi:hypothetical protein